MTNTFMSKQILMIAGVALAACFLYFTAVPAYALVETVFTDQASNITETMAQLNGYTHVSGDEGAEVWFEYGKGNSFDQTTLRNVFRNRAATFSAQVLYLEPATAYQARIVARDTSGTYRGEAVSFITKSSVPKLPYVSTSFAQNVTKSSALLRGSVEPYGDSATEVWFEWGTSVPPERKGVRLEQDGTRQNLAYPVSGLSDDTAHYFRIVAHNARGTAYGDIQSFDTGRATEEAEKDEPDVTTTNPTVLDGGSAVVFNGYVNTKGISTQTWFEWGKTSSLGNGTARALARTDSGNFSESLAGLEHGTVYYYRAAAVNKNGTAYGLVKPVSIGVALSAQDTQVLSPEVVTRPSVVTGDAETPAPTNILLRGSASSGGGNTFVWFEWGIVSSLGSATAGQPLGTVPSRAVSASIFDALPNTTYYYRLVAQNEAGVSHGSIQSVQTPAVAKVVPAAAFVPAIEPLVEEEPAEPLAASAFFGTDIFGPYLPEWLLIIFSLYIITKIFLNKF